MSIRKYQNKENVQKQAYYSDRFYVVPELPKDDPNSDEVYSKDIEQLKSKFELGENYIQRDELVIWINAKDNVEVLKFMRDELDYNFLVEMSAVDFLAKKGGFEIFYELLSLSKRKRVRVKTFIKENEAIETVEKIHRSANFSEREMFDMFGIQVNNHSYLKRILMPDDWEGYPLRKTYPLQGDEFAQWYEVDKIFGKEYREVIGAEIRDSGNIDRYDTKRFARLGKEVPFGTDISQNEPEETAVKFQEDEGVFLVKKLDKKEQDTLAKKDF